MCVLLCCFIAILNCTLIGGYLPVSQPLTVLTLENSLKYVVSLAPIQEGGNKVRRQSCAEEAQLPL